MRDTVRELRNQPKVKAFADKAALCTEAVNDKDGLPTLNLEVARKNHGQKTYDWGNRLVIQPDEGELIELVALFIGACEKVHMARPGKSIEIMRQENNYYLRAFRKSVLPMPVTHSAGFRIMMLALDQLSARTQRKQEFLVDMIRSVYNAA